ncbi:MAG TPA: alpha-L-fucosidase [Alphaproteobacteria bacterium]|nr:alpha-L-fucosidase [Alphaproteobacteria bacterium]
MQRLKNVNFPRAILFCLGIITFCCTGTIVFADTGDGYRNADPAALQHWQSNRFGMFIHFDPCALTGLEISWSRAGRRPDRNEDITNGTPAAEYDELYRQFNPSNFDADAWVNIAKDAGMKYIVFTAKHHDGFAMFDSKLTDYKISNTPFKRDICAELARACHHAGVGLGFYYSPPDWHHPDFFTANQARYNAYFHGQVRELLSNYGRVDILWFDREGGINTPQTWDNESLFPMIRALQPQILITRRCGGWGDFNTPEQRIGTYDEKSPWETCMTLGDQWSWKPNDNIKTASDVIHILATCAGGDGNLLLDVGPMPDGRIEPRQVAVLKQVGDWLNQNGESIYGTRGGPWKPGKGLASTRKGNNIYVHILNQSPATIELPAIPRQIVSASLLNGGNVGFENRGKTLVLTIPQAKLSADDTVVKLTLDAPAMDLPAIDVPEHFKTTSE